MGLLRRHFLGKARLDEQLSSGEDSGGETDLSKLALV